MRSRSLEGVYVLCFVVFLLVVVVFDCGCLFLRSVNCSVGCFDAGFIWPNTAAGSSHYSITWAPQTSMPHFMGQSKRFIHLLRAFTQKMMIKLDTFTLILVSFLYRRMGQILWVELRLQAVMQGNTFCKFPHSRWQSSCSSTTERNQHLRYSTYV